MVLIDGAPGNPTTTRQDRLDYADFLVARTPTPTAKERQRDKERRRKEEITRARVVFLDREQMILDMAAGGASLRQIAATVGLSPTHVNTLLGQALDLRRKEAIDRYVDLARERLSRLLLSVWKKAITPSDPDHLLALAKAQSLVADLLKLDGGWPAAKVNVDVSGEVRHITVDEVTEAIKQLEAEAAELERVAGIGPPESNGAAT